jgi:SAM-dependent methyltransferase
MIPMKTNALTLLIAVMLGLAACDGTGQIDSIELESTAQAAPPPAKGAAPERKPDVVYVPTPHAVVAEMLRMAKVGPKDTVYDLGCGDGRIVIAAARDFGARGVGIDIDPKRVAEARQNAKSAGVADRVEFRQADLFETDLGSATVVALYLLPELNLKLRPKLLRELAPGSRIVSQSFDMGDWKPAVRKKVEGKDVYLWYVPRR